MHRQIAQRSEPYGTEGMNDGHERCMEIHLDAVESPHATGSYRTAMAAV